jgi:hypothetical protein
MVGWSENSELEMLWKEAFVTHCIGIPGETEESHGIVGIQAKV